MRVGIWIGWLLMVILVWPGCSCDRTVAVAGLEDRGGVLPVGVAAQITDHLGGKLGEGGHYRVLLGVVAPCPDEGADCLQRLVQESGADYLLQARLLKPGERCSLILRLVERESLTAVRSTSVQCGCVPDVVLDAVEVAVNRLGRLDRDPAPVAPPQLVERPELVAAREPVAAPAIPAMQAPAATASPVAPLAKPMGLRSLASKPHGSVSQEAKRPAVEIVDGKHPEVATSLEHGPDVEAGESKADESGKEAARSGMLSINSVPWAAVELDGVKVGNTPIVRRPVLVGRHLLEFETQEGLRKQLQVEVAPDLEQRAIVRFDSEVEDASGYLHANSIPWSRVSVDGQVVGNTPIISLELPPGSHAVTFETKTGERLEQQVSIERGKTTKAYVKLPAKAPPNAASTPGTAK